MNKTRVLRKSAFLKTIFVSIACLAVFSIPILTNERELPELKISIVGGGISGLTTGYRIDKNDMAQLDVFEARGRLGGRILTARINGKITELGGYNLRDGGKAPNLKGIIHELGLTVKSYFKKRDTQWKCTKYFDGNKIIFTKSRLKKCAFDLDSLHEHLTQLAEEYASMKEVIDALFPEDPILRAVFAAKVEDYEGAAVEKLSSHCVDTLYYHLRGALNSAYGYDDDTTVPTEYVDGGNALIIEELGKKLDGKVHLNMPLERISKKTLDKPNSIGKLYTYELTFTTGESRTADIVVLTIPCSVYKDIVFDEDVIPAERVDAISKVLYGTNSKIMLPVISAKKGASSSYTNGRATLRLDDNNHATIYYIGNNGIFSPETIESHFKKDKAFIENSYNIDPNLPQPICAQNKQFIDYEGPVGHSWLNDPYIKGSYSCVGVGQEKTFLALEEYAGEKVKTLFVPIDDTLFFAGEHTSTLFEAAGEQVKKIFASANDGNNRPATQFDVDGLDVGGTMEAAVDSGNKAARIIENLYGNK